MKRKLITLMLVFASIAIFAQGQATKISRDGSVITQTSNSSVRTAAPDFTITCTDNSTFNLYTFLNAGTTHYVLMDLFFVD